MRAAAAAFVATARSPDLRRAQLSFAGASGAEWAFTVALGVFAFEQGGTAAVGLVTVLRMVPAALLAPAATSLGARTALRLQSLSSERFLTVVTGSPSAVGVVTIHMDDLLARYSPTPRDGG